MSNFKEAIDKIFGVFFEEENFTPEYAIRESNENYVAEIYTSNKVKLRFYRVEKQGEIGIDVAQPDAVSLSEFDQQGQVIWHDSWAAAGSPDSGFSLEELLDQIPEKFPSNEEKLVDLKEFLTEHFDQIVTNLEGGRG